MLNFDEGRFLDIQAGAVALAEPIDAFVSERLGAGARNVFFVGSGGAGILMQPAVRLLQTRSTFPTFLEMPAELVETGSVHLGAGSIVVIPSLSGTTLESIRALEYAKERGATVLTLTGHADTPLAEAADVNLTAFAADDTSSETFSVQSLLIALSIMRVRGEFDGYDDGARPARHAARRAPRREAGLRGPRRRARPRDRRLRLPRDHRRGLRAGPRRSTTACASSKRCSGSARGPCTPRTSSTARSSCSSPA